MQHALSIACLKEPSLSLCRDGFFISGTLWLKPTGADFQSAGWILLLV
jgi:hypothetical protein